MCFLSSFRGKTRIRKPNRFRDCFAAVPVTTTIAPDKGERAETGTIRPVS